MKRPVWPVFPRWMQADDDKLRAMALTGATAKNRTPTRRSVSAVNSRARRLNILLKKVSVKRAARQKAKGK